MATDSASITYVVPLIETRKALLAKAIIIDLEAARAYNAPA